MEPLVSAVIPVYNRREKIRHAIESVAAQTYKNIEIIVVDDGSTDGTRDVLDEYGDRIRCVRKENGGVSSARNRGAREAKGEFIAFLDSDDRWVPEKIEKQLAHLARFPGFSIIVCDCVFVREDGEVVGQTNRRKFITRDGECLMDALSYPSLAPSSLLLKKDVFFDAGGFDEDLRTAEDQDLMLKLAEKNPFVLIEEPLYFAMRSSDGLSLLPTSYDDTIFVVERFLRERPQIPASVKNNVLCKHYHNATLGKLWAGDYRAARGYFLSSLRRTRSFQSLSLLRRTVVVMAKVAGGKLKRRFAGRR
jgi:glycosyltransferase involved in cell wall biosynthesis